MGRDLILFYLIFVPIHHDLACLRFFYWYLNIGFSLFYLDDWQTYNSFECILIVVSMKKEVLSSSNFSPIKIA